MFRKPKRKLTESIRKNNDDELSGVQSASAAASTSTTNVDEDSDDDDRAETLREIANNKRDKKSSTVAKTNTSSIMNSSNSQQKESVMHTFDATSQSTAATTTSTTMMSHRDLVTSTAEHHPTQAMGADNQDLLSRNDGIYRGDQVRNKFYAGPIKAATHVRVTARFDYQPDICKDYKETGFCGYGDTCIYLHDRTDTVSGWQLERQWEEQQKVKKEKQEQIMNDFATGIIGDNTRNVDDDSKNNTPLQSGDDIPFACYICREHFKEPVVTNCSHYYCEKCIMNHVRTVSEACPICQKETGCVFNLPTKKRKVLRSAGSDVSNDDDSWIKYFEALQDGKKT
jgi:RING finger protein 113A